MTFARSIVGSPVSPLDPPEPGESFRWHFRQTEAFGGGGETGNEIWADHTFHYPYDFITPDGAEVEAGWVNFANLDSRDRNAARQKALRGLIFIQNSRSRRFWRINISGTIRVHAVFGDETAEQRHRFEVFDGEQALPGEGFLLWDYISPVQRWGVANYGANPVSAGQYSPGQAAFDHYDEVTITQPYMTVAIGVHPSGVVSTTLASLQVTKVA